MAFRSRRRLRSKRRFRRRRRFGTRRAKRFVKAVVRRMSETKYSATALQAVYDLNVARIINVTPQFPQGTTKSSRLGNKIRYKYVQFRLSAVHSNIGANPPQEIVFIRMLLLWLRVPLSAVPAIQDIFDVNNVASSIKNNAVRVVMDKTYTSRPLGAPRESDHPSAMYIKKKFSTHQNVNFAYNVNADPTDPKDQLYWVLLTDTAAANTNQLAVNFWSRFSFIDI